MERTNGSAAGFGIRAPEPAVALFLLIIRQSSGSKSECATGFGILAFGELVQSDATTLRPVSQGLGIDRVSPIVHIKVIGDSADRGSAAMGDAFGLLGPAEAKHGVKGEGAAQPLGLDGENVQVKRNIGGVHIRISLAGPLGEDAPDVALAELKFVDLGVVAQLAGAGSDFRPA